MAHHKRKIKILLKFCLLFGTIFAIIMSVFGYFYDKKYKAEKALDQVAGEKTETSEPIWITLPDGSEYQEDICDYYYTFDVETTHGGKTYKYIICPPEARNFETATPSGEITPEPSPIPTTEPTRGPVSYYSTTGCIGCSENMIMANGMPLDDSALTVAYNRAPLGSYIRITNLNNGKSITAEVTDRGGYEKYGKVADLSLATKEILSCGDICSVEIEEL